MSHIIGIDVSKATLDCAYLRDADQDKAKRKERGVIRTPPLILRLHQTFCQFGSQ
jgi:hypothetical protein